VVWATSMPVASSQVSELVLFRQLLLPTSPNARQKMYVEGSPVSSKLWLQLVSCYLTSSTVSAVYESTQRSCNVFLADGIGIHVKNSPNVWRIPFGFQLVPAGIMALGLLTVKVIYFIRLCYLAYLP
jgi:hypothetical protein